MNILAVESSCDETAVAIVKDGREVLTDCIASQVELHRIYGGVVPEIASRMHIEAIYALADQALQKAQLTREQIDAIAVTYAPGLIGAVLVGVNFAKAAALALDKPLIPVHHIRGHIAANYIAYPELKPPFLCLVVSGGHTMIVDVQDYTKMQILGTTLDDAAGECFDKVGRVLGMPYPGGAALDKAASKGDDSKYPLQIGAGLIHARNAVGIRHGTESQASQLREDEPHPVALLLPGLQFRQSGGVDTLLRFDKSFHTFSLHQS